MNEEHFKILNNILRRFKGKRMIVEREWVFSVEDLEREGSSLWSEVKK